MAIMGKKLINKCTTKKSIVLYFICFFFYGSNLVKAEFVLKIFRWLHHFPFVFNVKWFLNAVVDMQSVKKKRVTSGCVRRRC